MILVIQSHFKTYIQTHLNMSCGLFACIFPRLRELEPQTSITLVLIRMGVSKQ